MLPSHAMKPQMNNKRVRDKRTSQSLNITSQALKDGQTGVSKMIKSFNKDPLATMYYSKMYNLDHNFTLRQSLNRSD